MTAPIDLAALRGALADANLGPLIVLADAVLAAAEDGLVCGHGPFRSGARCGRAVGSPTHDHQCGHDFVPAVVLPVKGADDE